ncbi:nitrate reductase molybdenum cofactor assembly chaperone [Streptomyces spiroverticillatus]|uniref:Nitrate reductase molybdenum cofactor assembly chaperone n=1 Tax=Streptomyces finlayi TaxID=67296 RepID=A0A918X065_9ACTN|nr:nitrate reductase molybdenum cofactor assembly chaperone [Streptomyces finlayi]GHA18578.1 nitrate reductase molybdenum cofactor assembly chaperone [Streptomyces spiroverticillatus]GHD00094.1 nitrate reductase molybdenum cofactor assembly chaperone [Streptomyces finlayi]
MTTPTLTSDSVTRLIAGRCLEYPDSRLYQDLPQLRAALPDASPEAAALLTGFLDHVAATEPLDLGAHYTSTFDTRNRRCLYLTWWADGDTRRRGLSLVRLKQLYRDHGLEYADEELPDFLPVALDFAARHPEAGTALLEEHRVGLELLRLAVTAAYTPYTAVLEALCTTLPGPSPQTKEEAKAMARKGPPQELVGIGSPLEPLLEPFGPGIDLPRPKVAARTQPERPSA